MSQEQTEEILRKYEDCFRDPRLGYFEALGPPEKGLAVVNIRTALKRLNYEDVGYGTVYDDQLAKVVERFQRENGHRDDGYVGPGTRRLLVGVLLSKYRGSFPIFRINPSARSDPSEVVSRHEEVRRLRAKMQDRLDLDDIAELCFELGIDYENLSGDTKKRKLISLLYRVENREMIDDLVAVLSELRPDILKRSG